MHRQVEHTRDGHNRVLRERLASARSRYDRLVHVLQEDSLRWRLFREHIRRRVVLVTYVVYHLVVVLFLLILFLFIVVQSLKGGSGG